MSETATIETPVVRARVRPGTPVAAPVQQVAPTAPAPKGKAAKTPKAEAEPEEPKSELEALMGTVSKQYGAHVMRKASVKPPWYHLKTGIFTLDMALLGGVPEGLCTMPFGWESSGKTTTSMRIIAEAQRKYPDKKAVLIDLEGTYDPTWGAVHGVDNDALILVQPESGEMALDIAIAAIKAMDTSVVCIDSLGALTPMKEIEESVGDHNVGLQARLIGKFLRLANQAMINERARGHYVTILLINQYRSKISSNPKANPNGLMGGNALKYVVSVGVEIKNYEQVQTAGDKISHMNEHSFTIKKNKTGNSLKNGEWQMIRDPDHPLGIGFIDDAKTVVTFGQRFGYIEGTGSAKKTVRGLDEKFDRLQDVADYFYSDLEFYEDFRDSLITAQRERMGLIATGWNSKHT